MNDRECLKDLIADAEETVGLHSDARKPERERSVCAAFLRSLGVGFLVDEIRVSGDQPPDVLFHSARFEIREILDDGRKPDAEWKNELQRRKSAKELRDLLRPGQSRNPLSYDDLINRVVEGLDEKIRRYGRGVPATLDALVYVNLTRYYLAPTSAVPNLDKFIDQGWRSVSVLMGQSAIVLEARRTAPSFLRDLLGQLRREWTEPDGHFDL